MGPLTQMHLKLSCDGIHGRLHVCRSNIYIAGAFRRAAVGLLVITFARSAMFTIQVRQFAGQGRQLLGLGGPVASTN